MSKESSNSTLTPIEPAKPVAAYLGGKRNLAKTVITRINAVPHTTYAEPFVGMGGIFLRRGLAPKAEVINDYNGEVANLFRILQRHYPQFMDTIKFQITSRREFERLTKTEVTTLTDLERAARFLYLQRTAFGGKPSGQNFGVSRGTPARFDLTKLAPMLESVHERLSGVIIENLDFGAFIQRYDRQDVLFYLDPPYWGCEGDYGRELFSRDDFERLSALLKAIKGCFIMSLNDVPEIRSIFSWAVVEAVETTYSIAGGDKSKRAGEVIISGGG